MNVQELNDIIATVERIDTVATRVLAEIYGPNPEIVDKGELGDGLQTRISHLYALTSKAEDRVQQILNAVLPPATIAAGGISAHAR